MPTVSSVNLEILEIHPDGINEIAKNKSHAHSMWIFFNEHMDTINHETSHMISQTPDLLQLINRFIITTKKAKI